VVRVTEPLSYQVELESGPTVRKHVDSIRKRHAVTVEVQDVDPLSLPDTPIDPPRSILLLLPWIRLLLSILHHHLLSCQPDVQGRTQHFLYTNQEDTDHLQRDWDGNELVGILGGSVVNCSCTDYYYYFLFIHTYKYQSFNMLFSRSVVL